jgi:hypothetical protein
LNSLQEAYLTRKDGTIDIDDPGALKILALQSDVDNWLDKFQNAIPSSLRDKIKTDMDDYVQLVQKRNQAVVALNTTIQVLYQAEKDLAYYTQQHKDLGQQLLSIDTKLPAICFWLKKSRNDMKLLILQTLNYASRALRFWCLQPLTGFDSSA